MNITKQAKQYFNQLEFYEIIADPIVVNNSIYKINEHTVNKSSFKIDLKYCNENDILVFYQTIIDFKRQYLLENDIATKMIFYTWYNDMSGNFYFSIASQNSIKENSSFGCSINKVDDIKIIIQNFLNDPYKGKIPLYGCIEVDQSENDEYDDPKHYVLDVWYSLL